MKESVCRKVAYNVFLSSNDRAPGVDTQLQTIPGSFNLKNPC